MKTRVLCFSGLIGSGKTELSRRVARELGWKLVGFGDFLRNKASQKGLDNSRRKILQDLGQQYINNGWENFCKNVLKSVNWRAGENIVVDGVRHFKAVETLKKVAGPCDIMLVYVLTEDGIRNFRLSQREEKEAAGVSAEDHPVELETRNRLPKEADITVSGYLPAGEAAALVIERLEKSGFLSDCR